MLAVAANNDDPETRLAVELAATLALTLPNSRAGETEADRMGIELAARAGYDPAAGASLWLKMEEEGGSNPMQFLSTHPSPDNRRQALLDLERQVRPLMPAGAARALSHRGVDSVLSLTGPRIILLNCLVSDPGYCGDT